VSIFPYFAQQLYFLACLICSFFGDFWYKTILRLKFWLQDNTFRGKGE